MAGTTSRFGRLSTWLGRFSVVLVLLGPAVAHFELVRPIVGFGTFGFGLLMSVLALITGLLALIVGPERRTTALGMLPAIVVILAVGIASGARQNLPRINDITTDTANPPLFVNAQSLADNIDRDMAYPGAEFAEQQKAGYPDLGPTTLALPPDEAFKQVAAAARSMDGWNITREDAAARAVEGYDTSQLFRFKDDFVIEVRPVDGQSVVQMRSKSRVGKGDVGANAQRIRLFFTRLSN
ncbi:MAG: DUF1499 domain-containing protein [bacterium]